MASKKRPHHRLSEIQAKFASPAVLVITWSAMQDAQAIGYSLQDIVDVIQQLRPGDFVKSATAHNPISSTIWHDTYETQIGRMLLYLKFAGVALIDVKLVSLKEAR